MQLPSGLRTTTYLLFALFTTALSHAATARDSALEITIHIYDYSGTHPAAMTEAQGSATEVLRQAGIDVRWRNCPVPTPGVARGPACGSGTEDPTHFVVGVLPERMSRKIASGPQQFGMAITSVGGFPTHAYVFFDRVWDLAKDGRVPFPLLLGTIIAHEVGHLLLGNNSHFSVGIMRANWRLGEVKQALMGLLTFTPQQAEEMRSDVRRRVKTRE